MTSASDGEERAAVAAEVVVTVDRRVASRVLFAVPAILLLISLPLEYLRTQRGWSSLVTDLFRLSGEATLPTWWSSFLLLTCGLALLAIGRAVTVRARRRDWTLLGIIFVYMSVDELVQIHEILNGGKHLSGAVYFAWVIPATAFVIIVGVRFMPFLFALPPRRRRQFVVAGLVYVGAALVMEVPLGYVAQSFGGQSLAYRVVDSLEEALEIVGLSLFLLALLEELPPLRLSTRDALRSHEAREPTTRS